MEDTQQSGAGHWQPAFRPDVLELPKSIERHLDHPLEADSAPVLQDDLENSALSQTQRPAPLDNPAPLAVATPIGLSQYGPEELPSDDDDERLDPAWGIKRTDSTQVFPKVARTNSFPEFSPFSTKIGPPPPVPHSQAEQMMQWSEEIAAQQDHHIAISGNQPHTGREEPPPETNAAMAGSATERSLEQRPDEMEDAEQERFDEGVPLIPTGSHETMNGDGLDATFDSQFEPDETAFFDHAAPLDPQQPRLVHHLDRKNTTEVFESLHFSQKGPSDSPDESEHGEEPPTDELRLQDIPAEELAHSSAIDDKGMWDAAFDDEEFLVEDPDDLLPDSEPGSPLSFLKSIDDEGGLKSGQDVVGSEQTMPMTPSRDQRPDFARHGSSNPYAPHQPSTSDLTQLSPTTYSTIGLSRPTLAPMSSFQDHIQQRPAPQHTQSFVDQSKGGYKSPYDLPLELSKPRRRAPPLAQSTSTRSIPPPPRTSSMSSEKALQSPLSPTNSAFPTMARIPPARTAPTLPPSAPVTAPGGSQPKRAGSTSAFFEELPMTQRARPPTGQGRYTPSQSTTVPPPPLLPQSPPQQMQNFPHQQPPQPVQPTEPYSQFQLRPPEKLDPYSNAPLQTSSLPGASVVSAPTMSTRYSPAPPNLLAGPKPVPSPRYSPAPPPQSNATNSSRYTSQPPFPGTAAMNRKPSDTTQPTSNALPFQPRTSSPLAYQGMVAPEQNRQLGARFDQGSMAEPVADVRPTAGFSSQRAVSTGSSQAADQDSFYAPRSQPPRRSQTQSPSKLMLKSSLPPLAEESMNRPASVHTHAPPIQSFAPIETFLPSRSQVRQRGLSQSLNFIEPEDGQQHDPLQRWKGAPVFRFGFGGAIVSSFPRHVPRYSASAGPPAIKPSVGEVNVRHVKDVLPVSDLIGSFPGPLRAKSKKKEVLAWMGNYISTLEQGGPGPRTEIFIPDLAQRHQEKVLLWKVIRAFVEHDGVLDTGAEARRSVNAILSPDLFAIDDATATQYRDGLQTTGIYRPTGHDVKGEPIDALILENMRKHLLRGEREKAAWLAVDNRLWSHALLISSTLDRSVWKHVVQEFVRQEMKLAGSNIESLSAIYEIFAGNLEESIDELVPPSARAGLQMVSKVDTNGPTRNALDGLNKWRETLALVLNNRTPDDARALIALGRLLVTYGRVEAAQICQLFARGPLQPHVFGGVDEPQASIVLLGANAVPDPATLSQDVESLMLTEVFEFATSILNTSASSSPLPHLQAYKLQRALWLSENGRPAEAQAYCEAIQGSIKTYTKPSPYFHPLFSEQLHDLTNRLKQVPVQGSASWLAKPSIEKVSGSVWNKFTSFVAGEDSDAESRGSGRDGGSDVGPFAKVAGTPSLSRSGSQTDLYGSYPPQPVVNTLAGSRYAPNGLTSPRSSSELTRGRASLEYSRSPPSTSGSQSRAPISLEPSAALPVGYIPSGSSPYQSLSQSPPNKRYQATPPQTSYMPTRPLHESPQSQKRSEPYIPTPPPDQFSNSYLPIPPPAPEPESLRAEYPVYGGYNPLINDEASVPAPVPAPATDEALPATNHQPAQSYGYEPPSDTGYVPYEAEPDSDAEGDRRRPAAPKKKSFMDDDDEDFPRISNAPPPSTQMPLSKGFQPPTPAGGDDAAARKRANDAAAEAAFRAAAEADAAQVDKDKSLKSRASWFGGWLGGKKPDSLDAPAAKSGGADAGKTIHRAHLGESKMKFVYDEKLKRWINPDDPDSMTTKSATPPPPRMGGPMAARGLAPSMSMPVMPPSASGPGSGPPSRTSTPATDASTPAAGGPPLGAAPTSIPPYLAHRPNSSGSPGGLPMTGTPPPGGLVPPVRPASTMSSASSIDDLLGPVSAGGGRRTIKGKKGAAAKRYVDVMAK